MPASWPILVIALVWPTLGTWAYFVAADPDKPIFFIAYATTKVVQFGLPVVYLLAYHRERLRAIRWSHRGLLGGLVIGALIFVAIIATYLAILRGHPAFEPVTQEARQKLVGFGLASPMGFLLMAVFLSVVHSFLEEYYWRWFVFAGLCGKMATNAAILVSSAAFAAHHVLVLDVYFPDRLWTFTLPFACGVGVGGAMWAWWYHRRGSLAGSWLAHLLADAAIMGVGYVLLFGD